VPIPASLGVVCVGFDPEAENVYVGTEFGLFAASPPEAAIAVDRPLPIEAVPNPFSQHVTLRCSLPPKLLRQIQSTPSEASRQVWPSDRKAGAERLAQEGALVNPAPAPEILIVNVHGQLICRLRTHDLRSAVDGAGHLDWTWDGRDERGQEVPNGIYMISTRVGDQCFIGKVVKFR
jgi:hypothetical protein